MISYNAIAYNAIAVTKAMFAFGSMPLTAVAWWLLPKSKIWTTTQNGPSQFETGHGLAVPLKLCAFAHHSSDTFISYAFTQHSRETPTGGTLFGSPARKRWDEASARRFTPYPALWGASCCSVFVTALYEIARIVARGQKGCQASEQSIIHNSSFIIVLFLSFGFEIKMHLFQPDRAACQICPPEHGKRTLLSGQDYVRIDRREAGRWRNAGRSSGI